MLIKRLLHRWVLMEGEGGEGGAPAGEASAAAPAPSVSPSSTPAAAADTATVAPASTPATPEASKFGDGTASIDSIKSLADEGAKAPQADDKTADQPALDATPIEYTDFTLPDGFEASAEQMTAFKDAAAGAKLSQEQAQSFMDMHAKAIQDTLEASRKFNEESWFNMTQQDRVYAIDRLVSKDPVERAKEAGALMPRQEWQEQLMADPQFGGAKFESETKPQIDAAIKAYSPSPEAAKALRDALSLTSAGNHPDVVRFLALIGKPLRATHVAGTPVGGDGGRSAAAKLYPSTQTGNGQS